MGARYDVMAKLVGDRVSKVVREKLGASYGFSAEANTLRGRAAYLTLRGAVDNTHLAKALDAVKQAFAGLEQGQFGPGEVDFARWRVANHYAVGFTTSADIVAAILKARNEDRDPKAIDAYPNEIIGVTPDALKADFARCTTAPVISLVGDETTVRAAIAEAWP